MKLSVHAGARVFAWIVVGLLAAPASSEVTSDKGPDAIVAPALPLRRMIDIQWHRGPDLPMGFQNSVSAIVDGTLITSTGFCRGYVEDLVPGKEAKYPRERHLKETWGISLANQAAGWSALPDMPGIGRQNAFGIAARDSLYLWGGCEYNWTYTFKDGYRLSKVNDQWTWEKLPDLPFMLGSSGIAAIGSKIYVMGGSQYYLRGGGFYLTNVVEGGAPLGDHLMMLDTAEKSPAWRQLPPCPGTPRCVQAMAAVDGKLYVIGGAGENNPSGVTCTVVDNWRFDPDSKTWERLADLPVASGSFPSGAIVFQDRYILMIGGYQYDAVLGPDGKNRATYGVATKHSPDKDFFSDIFVYDTRTNTFGSATPLPLNNLLPTAVIEGNQLHLIGGETGGFEFDGERYGNNPELYLIGDLKAIEN